MGLRQSPGSGGFPRRGERVWVGGREAVAVDEYVDGAWRIRYADERTTRVVAEHRLARTREESLAGRSGPPPRPQA